MGFRRKGSNKVKSALTIAFAVLAMGSEGPHTAENDLDDCAALRCYYRIRG